MTLVHLRSDADIEAQIQSVNSLLTMEPDIVDLYHDADNVVGFQSEYHQELTSLAIPHAIKGYQIIPYGRAGGGIASRIADYPHRREKPGPGMPYSY